VSRAFAARCEAATGRAAGSRRSTSWRGASLSARGKGERDAPSLVQSFDVDLVLVPVLAGRGRGCTECELMRAVTRDEVGGAGSGWRVSWGVGLCRSSRLSSTRDRACLSRARRAIAPKRAQEATASLYRVSPPLSRSFSERCRPSDLSPVPQCYRETARGARGRRRLAPHTSPPSSRRGSRSRPRPSLVQTPGLLCASSQATMTSTSSAPAAATTPDDFALPHAPPTPSHQPQLAHLADDFTQALDDIRSKLPDSLHSPKVALVCGSGLQGLAEQLSDPVLVPYGDIAGFGESTGAFCTLLEQRARGCAPPWEERLVPRRPHSPPPPAHAPPRSQCTATSRLSPSAFSERLECPSSASSAGALSPSVPFSQGWATVDGRRREHESARAVADQALTRRFHAYEGHGMQSVVVRPRPSHPLAAAAPCSPS